MKQINLLLLILNIVLFNFSYAQEHKIVELRSKYNSLGSFWVFSFEGGMTYPFTDYQKSLPGYLFRSSIEYFLPSEKFFTSGIRISSYFGELNGHSNTGRPAGDGNLKRVIKNFNTPYFSIEPSIVLVFGYKTVIPYLAGGAEYIISFIPLEDNSYSLFMDSKRSSAFSFITEFGMRFFITNKVSYNIALKFNFGKSDELDGFVSRKKDVFFALSSGLSFHLFRKERLR